MQSRCGHVPSRLSARCSRDGVRLQGSSAYRRPLRAPRRCLSTGRVRFRRGARRGKAARYLRADGHKLVFECNKLLHARTGLRAPVITARLTQKARAHSDFHAILLTRGHAGRRASKFEELQGTEGNPRSQKVLGIPRVPRDPPLHFFMKPSISLRSPFPPCALCALAGKAMGFPVQRGGRSAGRAVCQGIGNGVARW